MKKKKWIVFMLFLFISVWSLIGSDESYQAATSYTNAKEFYDSTALDGEPYHSESRDGAVYYATYSKLASSSTNLKYATVGFDITLSGNGYSVSFAVEKFGDSVTMVDQVNFGGYQYDLYAIEDKELYRLAQAVDSANADHVLDASKIRVQIDAIMVTKQGGTPNGGIVENGYGEISKWGTIYRLKNGSDLNSLKSIFSGHYFKSYKEIKSTLDNPKLDIMYNIGQGAKPQATGYSSGSITQNGIVLSDMLFKSGTVEKKSFRVLQQATLVDTGKDGMGLIKTGYHLEPGKEWKKSDGTTFASGGKYMPREIVPAVGFGNKGVVLYANWKPNSYTISYDANGGSGNMAGTNTTYDKAVPLRNNTFTRTGYTFKGWSLTKNGTVDFVNGATVSNLTSTNGGEVKLYAVWEPEVYKITLDSQGAEFEGTSFFYEKYGVGFYPNNLFSTLIARISLPAKTGYNFQGYFADKTGGGGPLIDTVGNILAKNTAFLQDTTLFARWQEKTFEIAFDKQGGSYGSDYVIATYNHWIPKAQAPIRAGFTFKGYYTAKGGMGTLYYDEFMNPQVVYKNVANTTLYAYWIDTTAPEVFLNVSIDTWTNQQVTLEASARDKGSGLSSVEIFQITDNGTLISVVKTAGLNGAKSKNLNFVNATEGVIRYKAVATDMKGNVSESYNTVYYDKTKPNGEVEEFSVNGTTIYIDVNVTDINPGD
ncbi:MAG: InlB B-repeat-containing protein [Agathobacter sp.]|nr:InlB B-repeat-containing protein [Agathobacter sp.]